MKKAAMLDPNAKKTEVLKIFSFILKIGLKKDFLKYHFKKRKQN